MLTGKKIYWGLLFFLTLTFGLVNGQESPQAWEGEDPQARSGGCPFFTLTPNPTSPTCNGFNDGVASVIVSDGVGPFTYSWVGGPSTQTWNNVGAGTYTVIVFDQGQGGAPCNIDVFVNEPGPLSVFGMNATSPTCFGACNGQAAPIVIGGGGGYTYSWDSGETGFSANQLCNPFTLTVTDGNGCVLDTTYTFTNEPDEVIITADTTDISCAGEADGAINISVEGGIPDYTYNWSGPGGFSSSNPNIENLAAGQYTVTVTDANGCEANATFEITEPDPLSVQADVVNNPCAADSLGSISLTPTGGTPDYVFQWSGPSGFTSFAQDISGLITGSYNLTLTDANGCEVNETYSIDAPPAIDIDFSVEDLSCFEENDGAIDAQVSGGAGDFTFEWSGPEGFTATSSSINGLASGEYTLTATDSSGCSINESIVVDQPLELTVSGDVTSITCNGANDGSATVEVEGGTPDYTFDWIGPGGFSASTANISDLIPGEYIVTVTDANGCTAQFVADVAEPDSIVLDGVITDATCNGVGDGAIELNVDGGVPPYTYAWSGPFGFTSGDQSIFDILAGNYTVLLTDAQGCTSSASFTVDFGEGPEIEAVVTDASCDSNDNGEITATVTGGTPPYSIFWIGPGGFTGNTLTITGLSAGTYTIFATDAADCFTEASFTVNNPTGIEIDGTVTDLLCDGDSNGAIDITLSGPTNNITTQWAGPDGFTSTDISISDLVAGNYTFTVTDSLGCVTEEQFVLTSPPALDLSVLVTPPECDVSNGQITAVVSGGTVSNGYTYLWTDIGNNIIGSDAQLSGLGAGVYTITVSDDNGCTTNTTVELSESDIQVDADITEPLCIGDENGAIEVQVSGGIPPYILAWAGPNGFTSSDASIFNLSGGTYTLTVTDSLNCDFVQVFNLTDPDPVSLVLTPTLLTCPENEDGAIVLEINGGTPGYNVSWTGPDGFTSSDQNISDLAGGVYVVEVTDANGCDATDSAEILAPDPLDADLTVTPVSCNGANDGAVDVAVSGGAPNYVFDWTGPGGFSASTANISDLIPGEYIVTVTDANGCIAQFVADVAEPDSIVLDGVITDATCNGVGDGAIELNVDGGVPPYTYAWSGPFGFTSGDQSIFDILAGNYTVLLTDAQGCTSSASFTVDFGEGPEIEAVVTDASCDSNDNGEITATVTGGTPPYSIFWIGPGGFTGNTLTITGLSAGTYTIFATDAADCFTEASFTVNNPTGIEIDGTVTDLLCDGDSNGAIDITLSGPTNNITTQWAGPDGFTSTDISISGLVAGNYTFTVTDSLGCVTEEQFVLTSPPALDLSVLVTPPSCDVPNGQITAVVSGGTVSNGYTYLWTDFGNNIIGSNAQLSGLGAGVYTITVSDDNGCTTNTTVELSESDIQVDADITEPLCIGDENGAIEVQVSGGIPPYILQWAGPNGFSSTEASIFNLASGIYTLTVTDSLNCDFVQVIELNDPDPIVLDGEITDATCNGVGDGAIELNVDGGVPPYTYSWSGPFGFTSGDQSIFDILAGNYTVLLTDAQGCTSSASFTVDFGEGPEIEAVVTDASCDSNDNGEITATVTGGTPPYSIFWIGPGGFTGNTLTITGLSAGTYTIFATDAADCFTEASFTVNNPTGIEIDGTVTDLLCDGDSNGAIDITLSGPTNNITTQWAGPDGFTSTNISISGLVAGNYTFTVTDSLGCVTEEQFVLTSPPALDLSVLVTPPSCDVPNGQITAVVSGGTVSNVYTYLWTDIGNNIIGSDAQLSGLGAGIYTITVSDDNGCTTNTTVELSESDIEVDADITEPLCNGDENGAIEVQVSGGTPPYILQWAGPDGFTSNDASIVNLSGGTYTLTVTDSLNCDFVQVFNLTDPDPLTVDLVPASPICAEDGLGAIVTTVSGGTPDYDFNWSGPNGFTSEVQNITDLEAGTYVLEVSDANGCTVAAQTTISIPAALTLDAEVLDIICFGDTTGAINLNLSGGTPNYTVTWQGPDGFSSNEVSISNLTAGTYLLNVLDSNLCALDTAFTISEPAEIEVDVTVTPVLCFGDNNGEIAIQISGGTPGYTVNWSGPDGFASNELIINPTEQGDYLLSVIDSAGCETELSIPFIIPEELILSLDINQPECLQNDGAITVSVQGGMPPFSYLWEDMGGNTLGTDSALTGLGAGQYLVIVTDSNNCEVSELVDLSDLGGEIIGQVVDVTCFGGSDGAITTQVLNAIEPLAYAWSAPDGFSANTPDITNLEANNYTLIVTDSLGCVFVETFEVNQPDSISVSAEITEISCFGGDGAITAIVTGGTPPYNATWSGPDGFVSDTLSIADLDPGTYTLTIEDDQGCTAEFSVELEELDEIEIDFDVVHILCAGEASGQIVANVSGGAPDYTYAWVGPDGFVSDAATISDLSAGFYDLQVTDSNGCTETSGVLVEEPEPLDLNVIATNATCGNTNGSAEATVTGGTVSGDYTYVWTDSGNNIIDTTAIIQNLGPGTYTVTVTDDNGCEVAETIAISDSDGELLADIVMPTCGAGNDGAIVLTVLGATEPLIYDWTGPEGFASSDQNIFDLIPGNYVVQVTDSLGCVLIDVYELEEPTTVQLEFDITPISCAGDSNGAISLTVIGAFEPYNVSWTGPDGFVSTDTSLTDLAAGTYEVTVVDSLLCIGTGTVNLVEPDSIAADFVVTDNLCADDTLGTITTIVAGGTAPYQFQWIGPNGFESTNPSHTGLLAGFYEVLITDSLGCTAQFAVEIDSSPAIAIDLDVNAPDCFGEASGSVFASVSGGAPDYNYSWTGPDGFTSDIPNIENLFAGNYTLEVIDSLGCSVSVEVELTQPDSLIIESTATQINCHGDNDGEIVLDVLGGTLPFTYAWTGPNGFEASTAEITGLEAGTYSLLVTDSLGCSGELEVELTQPDPISLNIDNITDAVCSTDDSGAIDVSATGGVPPYNFTWTGPDEFTSDSQNLSEIFPGEYELLLTDSNGCEASLTAEVDYLFEIDAEAGTDLALCENEQNELLIGIPTNGDDTWWTDVEGEIISDTDTLSVLLLPGEYTFYYNVTNGLCSAIDSVTVTIFALPDADAGAEQTIIEGEEVVLGGNPTSSTATDYLWTPNITLNDSTVANPTGTPEQTTTYQVWVTDENGCSNSDFTVVIVVPDIDIPTGISPNGDGYNDLWIIDHIEQFPGNVVEVYNRWGDQLYRTEGYDNNDPWDGFYNGVELPVGTYYYVIELNDERFPGPYTGPLTIFR